MCAQRGEDLSLSKTKIVFLTTQYTRACAALRGAWWPALIERLYSECGRAACGRTMHHRSQITHSVSDAHNLLLVNRHSGATQARADGGRAWACRFRIAAARASDATKRHGYSVQGHPPTISISAHPPWETERRLKTYKRVAPPAVRRRRRTPGATHPRAYSRIAHRRTGGRMHVRSAIIRAAMCGGH